MAVSERGSRRATGAPRRGERKAAPPVAEAAAWSSNEAQSSDSFSWLNDNAELRGSSQKAPSPRELSALALTEGVVLPLASTPIFFALALHAVRRGATVLAP